MDAWRGLGTDQYLFFIPIETILLKCNKASVANGIGKDKI
jgi:hypothetical protein